MKKKFFFHKWKKNTAVSGILLLLQLLVLVFFLLQYTVSYSEDFFSRCEDFFPKQLSKTCGSYEIVFSLSKNKKKRKWCESFFFAAVKSHFSCTNWSQKFFWEFFLHIRVKFFITSLRVIKNFTRMCKKNSKKNFWLQWVQEKCDFAAGNKNDEHHLLSFRIVAQW